MLASSHSEGTSENAPTPNSAVKSTGQGTLKAFPTLSSSSTFQSSGSVKSKIHLVSKAEQKKGFPAVCSRGVKLDSRSQRQCQGRERVANPPLMHSLTRFRNGNARGVKRSRFMGLQSRDMSQDSDVCDARTVSVSSFRDDDMFDESSNLDSQRNAFSQPSKEATWNHGRRSNMKDESKISLDISLKTHGSMQPKAVMRGEATGKRKNRQNRHVSAMRSESCSRSSGFGHGQSFDALETNINSPIEKECITLKSGVPPKKNPLSNGTNVESVSPDHTIEMIGKKNFWRARKMICNQQRIFSMQVFELHRLIKAQRSLVGSAELLLEGNLSLAKQMNKSSLKSIQKPLKPPTPPHLPLKIPQPPPRPSPVPPPIRLMNTNTSVSSLESCQFVPSLGYDLNQGSHSGLHRQCKSASSLASVDNCNKVNTCFHPPTGNQWLVPVMSPSEGLVYKLYAGSYPPLAPGFMAPVLGACGPFSFPSDGSHLFNQAYGVGTASDLQNGAHSNHNSFFLPQPPPHDLSLTKLFVNEAVVQPFLGNSCNNGRKFNNSRVAGHEDGLCEEGEVQQQQSYLGGIDAVQSAKEVLPLFPVKPASSGQDLEQLEMGLDCEYSNRVIKVVPRNGRLACQSALKIFQCIDEERRWYDSIRAQKYNDQG